MQVNFGRTIVKHEFGVRPNRYQTRVNDIILDTFGIPQDEWSAKESENTRIEKLLEDKKGADVLIKNKADGSVDLELRCDYIEPVISLFPMSTDKGYIPYDTKGKSQLQIKNIKLNDKNSLAKIKKNIVNFALKCRAYAMLPDTEKNTLLAEKHEILRAKELVELERKGLL